jgi:hypothetical protein
VTSVRLPVNVLGDTISEVNEQFTITLTSTNLRQIVDDTAVCTIIDDDIQDPMPVEQFTRGEDGFDLAYSSVTFTPEADGASYAVTTEPISSLPTDSTGGTAVPAGNDNSTHVELSTPVTLFGQSHSDLFINTNGSVSFDQPVTEATETIAAHNAVKQISALFAATQGTSGLDTTHFGQISYRNLSDRLAITWDTVPAYGSSVGNTFQIELFHNGTIRLSWLDITQIHAIVGLSKGILPNLNVNLMNFSAYRI